MDEADGVVLIAYKSTDNETELERHVLNILLMPINVEKSESKLVAYIADKMFEHEVNHKIIKS